MSNTVTDMAKKEEAKGSEEPRADEIPAKRTAKRRSRRTAAKGAAVKKRASRTRSHATRARSRVAPKRGVRARDNTHTKAGFVRSMPYKTPAAEVVAKARAAGMTLDSSYVHHTRSVDKKKGVSYPTMKESSAYSAGAAKQSRSTVGSTASGASETRTPRGRSAAAGGTAADATFYATLKQIGVERARQLIARFEAALIS